MPACPELREAAAVEGRSEIACQLDPEETADAAGHIRVAGEIVVDGEHPGEQPQDQHRRRELAGGLRDVGRDPNAQRIGDDQFAEETKHDEPAAPDDDIVVNSPTFGELGKEVTTAFNGSGNQLREVAQVE